MNRWILGGGALLCSTSLWAANTLQEPRTQDLDIWFERSSTMVYTVTKAKKWAQEAIDRAQKEKNASVAMQLPVPASVHKAQTYQVAKE